MDYGYTQYPESDVNECCLVYPPTPYFWSNAIHFSTKDCLYEGIGAHLTDYGLTLTNTPTQTCAGGRTRTHPTPHTPTTSNCVPSLVHVIVVLAVRLVEKRVDEGQDLLETWPSHRILRP